MSDDIDCLERRAKLREWLGTLKGPAKAKMADAGLHADLMNRQQSQLYTDVAALFSPYGHPADCPCRDQGTSSALGGLWP